MAESDDLRAFIRDLMARFDRGMDAVIARQEAQREESRRYFERMEERDRLYFESLKADTEEIRAEGRAGREALFRILDRLDGNGGTSPA
jgi:hypothetical protein